MARLLVFSGKDEKGAHDTRTAHTGEEGENGPGLCGATRRATRPDRDRIAAQPTVITGAVTHVGSVEALVGVEQQFQ